MFCMAWFMELSRLSNSLGSVCSQRRGRLAAVAGRPQLPHSLSHHSPPFLSLQSRLSVCVCFFFTLFLSHCAHELAPAADPRSCCAFLSWTSLRALWHWPDHQQGAKVSRGVPHNGPLSAGLWLSAALLPPAIPPPPPPPPQTPQPEERERLWHEAWLGCPLLRQLSSPTYSTASVPDRFLVESLEPERALVTAQDCEHVTGEPNSC